MKKIKLLTYTISLVLLCSFGVKAAPGDFYYGDASALTRVDKSEVKSQKDILKNNKNNLYYQPDSNNIVNYEKFSSKLMIEWASGKFLVDSFISAKSDADVQVPDDIKRTCQELDENYNSQKFNVESIY